MSTPQLDYDSSTGARERRGLPWRRIVGVGVVLAGGGGATQVTVRHVERRMDPVTGTVWWKTVWMFGVTSPPRMEVSALERRLKRSGIGWSPSWRFLDDTERNVFGGVLGRGCATAPPVYGLG